MIRSQTIAGTLLLIATAGSPVAQTQQQSDQSGQKHSNPQAQQSPDLEIQSQPVRYQFRTNRKTEEVGRVALPESFLRVAGANPSSYRLFDKSNQPVPYALFSPLDLIPSGGKPSTTAARIDEFSLVSDGERSEARLIATIPEGVETIDGVELDFSGKDFYRKASIEVYRSDDETWATAATGSLFDFSSRVDLRKNSLEFRLPVELPEDEDDRKIKVTLLGTQRSQPEINRLSLQVGDVKLDVDPLESDFRIDAIRVHSPGKSLNPYRKEIPLQDFSTSVEQDSEGDRSSTVSIIELPRSFVSGHALLYQVENDFLYRPYRVEQITRDPESDRERTHSISRGTLKRFIGGDARLRIPVDLKPNLSYQIVIENGDSEPIRISGVMVEYYIPQLFFPNRCEDGCTLYGGSKVLEQPSYDFSRVVQSSGQNLLKTPPSSGYVTENAHYNPELNRMDTESEARHSVWILRGVVFVLAVVLLIWIFKMIGGARKARQHEKEGQPDQ